jgi:hypothetical protein
MATGRMKAGSAGAAEAAEYTINGLKMIFCVLCGESFFTAKNKYPFDPVYGIERIGFYSLHRDNLTQ